MARTRQPVSPENELRDALARLERSESLLAKGDQIIGLMEAVHAGQIKSLERQLEACRKDHAKQMEALRKVHARDLANARRR